jgi:hypothetical protein
MQKMHPMCTIRWRLSAGAARPFDLAPVLVVIVSSTLCAFSAFPGECGFTCCSTSRPDRGSASYSSSRWPRAHRSWIDRTSTIGLLSPPHLQPPITDDGRSHPDSPHPISPLSRHHHPPLSPSTADDGCLHHPIIPPVPPLGQPMVRTGPTRRG